MASVDIVFRVDLFSDLLAQLSEEGLRNLEGSIKAERYRRIEIKRLEYPKEGREAVSK
jgi:hypothetical protein